MKNLFKLRSCDSISKENFNKIQASCIIFQNFNASIHTKSSKYIKKGKNQKIQVNQMQKESNEIASIFTKITDIIGTEHLVIPEKSESSRILDAHAIRLKSNVEDSICSPSVCRIVNESRVEESHLGNSQGDDVSPIVHKITEIVRAENATISMEERLEKAGFEFNSEIVEKVLKRCFKVGDLALRFFDWLKHGVGFRHTSDTYNTMIYIAGEAKEFNVMERLMEEMERESCPKDIKTWTILISSYGKVKLIGKALLVFERMRKCGYEPDETVYKVIVSALCNAGKSEIAMEFYKEMVNKNIEVDMNLYKLLLNCLSGAGNISEVRLIGEDMMNVSQIPGQKVYSCILRSFCIARKIREALKLLHELRSKDIMLDPENFEILVKGLCRDGKISDALEIVAIMKQNHVVDAKIHGIVINGYLRRNEVLKAFQLFSSMKESGHTPTASTYTELLQQLFRSKEYDRACKLYDEMLGNEIQQDIVAMTAVIAGHIQNNCVPQAWKIYEGMREKKIKLTYKFYSVAIKELSKVLRTDEALKLVDEMRHSKMKVGDNIFQGIISALNKKGEGEKVDKVKQMWRTSKLYDRGNDSVGLDTEPQTLCRETEIVIDICKHKEPDQELSSNQIQQSKVDVEAVSPSGELYEHRLQQICSILSSPLNWSSMQEALEECMIDFTPELVLDVLQRCQLHGHAVMSFFSWVSQQAHYNHTTETYNMAIKISGCAKDFKHMRNLHLEMRRRGCTVTAETWTIMIMQYGRAGLTDIALRKFQEMKVDGFKPSKSTFKYLIVLLCGKKGRKVDEAIKTFHQMINARHVPDKELVEIYLQCLCEEGKISDARWCMESLLKGGFSVPLSYSLVIRSLCRAGRLEEALALEAEVGEEKHTLDQYIYGSLVHGLLRAGRVEEALAKVETMKEGGVGATVHVHTSLIVHFFKEKKIEKALEYFKRIREEGCEPTIVTYSALIRGYMNMGMVIDARNVFRRMKVKGPYPDFKTYSMFITCLCDMGRSEEAMQLINDMLDNGIFPSTVNFRTIFYGLNREGKQDMARTVLQKKGSLVCGRKFNQSNVSIFKSSSHNLTYNKFIT